MVERGSLTTEAGAEARRSSFGRLAHADAIAARQAALTMVLGTPTPRPSVSPGVSVKSVCFEKFTRLAYTCIKLQFRT